MPKFQLAVPHQLTEEEALTRLHGLLERVRAKYGDQVKDLVETWVGNTLQFGFNTYGFGVKGTVTVDSGAVKLDGDLPFAAMMFKGKIEQELKSTLERVLA